MPFRERLALYALLTSLTALNLDALLPALSTIAQDLPPTPPLAPQHIVSLFVLGMAIGEIGFGPLSDAIGRKAALFWGLRLYGCGTIIGLFANSAETLILARILQGIGVAGPKIATRALIRDQFQGDAMARVMSLMFTLFILVPMLAPALGQGLLHLWGWQSIFWLFLTSALAAGLWLRRHPETLPPDRRVPLRPRRLARNLARIAGTPRVSLLACTAGVIFGAQLLYLSTAADIFAQSYGITTLFVAYFAGLSLSFALAALLNARLVMRFGMKTMTLVGLLGLIGSGAAMAGVAVLWPPMPLPLFLLGCAACFFCMGLIFGNINALAMEPLGALAGLGAAYIAAASSAVSALFAVAAGAFHDGTPVALCLAMPVAGLLGLALTGCAFRTNAAQITPCPD